MKCLQSAEPGVRIGIVDGVVVELVVSPFFEADLANVLDVAGTGAISEAVECMEDCLVFGKLRNGQFALEGAGQVVIGLGVERSSRIGAISTSTDARCEGEQTKNDGDAEQHRCSRVNALA